MVAVASANNLTRAMSPVILAILTWFQWTPKDTRKVVGLRRSIADRVESSLDAVTPHTPSNLLQKSSKKHAALFARVSRSVRSRTASITWIGS